LRFFISEVLELRHEGVGNHQFCGAVSKDASRTF